MNRTYKLLLILIFTLWDSGNSHARLHESSPEAKARYGSPVNESGIIMFPLLNGTKELRYHHNGWRIRSAYLNDQAVIMSYMKLTRPSTPESVLQKDEIQAILEAEADDYKWIKVKSGTKVTSSKQYQGYFNSATGVWKRSDGAVAWMSANNALSIISQEGLDFEAQSQKQKEKQRKANLTDF